MENLRQKKINKLAVKLLCTLLQFSKTTNNFSFCISVMADKTSKVLLYLYLLHYVYNPNCFQVLLKMAHWADRVQVLISIFIELWHKSIRHSCCLAGSKKCSAAAQMTMERVIKERETGQRCRAACERVWEPHTLI